MRRAALISSVLSIAALGVIGSACSDDGRDLREPGPDQTASIITTSTTSTTIAPAFTLTGPWVDGTLIQTEYTCKGTNVSPPLAWSGVPAGTVELAIVVTDPDADGYVHWVLSGIEPTVTSFAQGAIPPGAVEARNDNGTVGYFGPCPPAGQTHRYVFTLHAMAEVAALDPGLPADEAVEIILGNAFISAELTGTFP